VLIEICFHGRGGQGAVTAANLLVSAAIKSGFKDVQSFPLFGAERRGAPVKAFARLSDEEINLRSQIYSPDVVVVMDPSIMETIDITDGLKENSAIIMNSPKDPSEFDIDYQLATVDATGIAIKYGIKVGGIPVVNTPILGAIPKIIHSIKLESIKEAIIERWPGDAGEKNARAAEEAFNSSRFK
jgi:pyruvate ferredoxin oxidoreductase gamma subunit/2-oxoisovalerate ferredoxin oxidoreductase gamma subunit